MNYSNLFRIGFALILLLMFFSFKEVAVSANSIQKVILDADLDSDINDVGVLAKMTNIVTWF